MTQHTFRGKFFDVDFDRSFSTQGLCTGPNPSRDRRQFWNDLYFKQGEPHPCKKIKIKNKENEIEIQRGTKSKEGAAEEATFKQRGSTFNLISEDRRNKELAEKWSDRDTFQAKNVRGINSKPHCSCRTVAWIQGSHRQAGRAPKREFSGSSAMSHKPSYLNHAPTYLTVVCHVPRRWTWKAIFMLQQKQLSFHVLVCHLTSECRHSALRGCQRAMSCLLKKV